MVAYTEAGGSWAQGQLRQYSEFEAGLRLYSKTVLKTEMEGNTAYRLPDRKKQ